MVTFSRPPRAGGGRVLTSCAFGHFSCLRFRGLFFLDFSRIFITKNNHHGKRGKWAKHNDAAAQEDAPAPSEEEVETATLTRGI